MQILFLDLDETLVRTTHASGAVELFVPGKRFPKNEVTPETQAAMDHYRVICAQEDWNALADWGRDLGVYRVPYPADEEPMFSMLRPKAKELLSWTRTAFDQVHLMTAGMLDFQKLVLQVHGIDSYFDQAYGRDEINEHILEPIIDPEDYAILVDDNHTLGSLGWQSKMTAIGILREEGPRDYKIRQEWLQSLAENHFVAVRPWHGKREDDELSRVMQNLKDLL